MAGINVREAKKTDATQIYELMKQQAAEQNTDLSPHVMYEDVAEGGWGPEALFVAFVAERTEGEAGKLEGYILAHTEFSTLMGRGMYIKEIYVVPAARRSGLATLLCRKMLQAALNKGCSECCVRLDVRNKASTAFFEKLGARDNSTEGDGWHLFSMDIETMTQLKARCEVAGLPKVRQAATEDMANVMVLVQELRDYHELSHYVQVNEHTLVAGSTPPGPLFECFVAETDGTLMGHALCYHIFSSQGRGIYMEDLYVRPAHRGQGLGAALMAEVAKRGLALGASRLDFAVLASNARGISFYQHQGATDITAGKGVHVYHFAQSAMRKCAQQE